MARTLIAGSAMRATLIAAFVLVAALAISFQPVGAAANCSPLPTVVQVQCLPVPGAGAVGIQNVPGVGVFVIATAGLTCGSATLPSPTSNTLTVTCTGPSTCADPLAFGMTDAANGQITTTAACGGSVSASCTTGPAPSNVCFGRTLGVGSMPFTCTVNLATGASLGAFLWWAECAQPAV
jgi:hypothetical protein